MDASCKAEAKAYGCLWLKLSPFVRGSNDRLLVLPGGVTAFVELKRTDTHPTDAQIEFHSRLAHLGQNVAVVRDRRGLRTLIMGLLKGVDDVY